MPAHGQGKKKDKQEGFKPRNKPTKMKKATGRTEESEEEDSDEEKKSQADDGEAFKIRYVALHIYISSLARLFRLVVRGMEATIMNK